MTSQKEEVKPTVSEGTNEALNVASSKKRRRGISNETRSTTLLKFNHDDAYPGIGLFIGTISARIAWVTIGNDSKSTSFIGKAVPQLIIDFVSLHEPASAKKHNSRTIWARESNADNIESGKNYKFINADFAYMKHILEVVVLKGRPLTPEEEDALVLDYVDWDENGQYEPVEADEVIRAWQVLFESFIKILETSGKDGKSALLADNGKPRHFWGKLLRYQKINGEWTPTGYGSEEGDLCQPTFVGEGIFEEVIYDPTTKQPKKPAMVLNIVKECIKPMDISRKKPNLAAAPGIGSIPIGGGQIPPSFMGGPAPTAGGFDNAFADNNQGPKDDLPF